jgi:hypothetical protein
MKHSRENYIGLKSSCVCACQLIILSAVCCLIIAMHKVDLRLAIK